jgi:uncharacterized protein YdhG (YjbR/CyaY superfamily)
MRVRKVYGVAKGKIDARTVDEYIASQGEPVQNALKRVRNAIRKAVPDAEEVISYKIPAFKLNGSTVLYFAGWGEHYSIYPANDRVKAAFKAELDSYEVTKGTIRIPLSQPVPVKLIERIAKFRVKELAERAR